MKRFLPAYLLPILFSIAFFASCGVEEWTEPLDPVTTTDTTDEGGGVVPPPDPCNGLSEFCGMRYSDLVYPTTVLSFACEDCAADYTTPFQGYGLTKQLEDGIRAISLDVFDAGGELKVYYLFEFLGSQSLVDVLDEVKEFMDANPREVVTIFLQGNVNSARMAEDFQTTGLDAYAHTQGRYNLWPTLGNMVDKNQRLVVFSDATPSTTPGVDPLWIHQTYNYVVSTEDQYISSDDFNCDFATGDPFAQLYLINQWVLSFTTGQGKDAAAENNTYENITSRVANCEESMGKSANFIRVTWYDIGDVIRVADSLNAPPPKASIE